MSDDELLVTTPQGTLQGTWYTSEFNNIRYGAFFGIPYAKPPVNNLRFMPPIPAEKWRGTLFATQEKNECLHYSVFKRAIVGSEDCLYLNVFTPKPPREIKSKAVIVQIHGGGYDWGSSSVKSYGAPDFIVHHDVIYVTFNFRLHLFGFLNLNLPNCAGNMGLKDQVMALKWIQQNIKHFGGDPDNVTLCGYSSGATSIHLHMMAAESKGLFHKVILQSGYAMSPLWNMTENPIERALDLAHHMGFRGDNIRKLYLFFRHASSQDLMVAIGKLRAIMRNKNPARPDITMFSPSVEKSFEGAFLTQSPTELLYKTISIPMICSLCEVEGVTAIIADPIQAAKIGGLSMIIEKNLWMYKMSPATLQHVTDQIQSFYFGTEKNYERYFSKLMDLYSDMHTCEWQEMVDFQAEKSDLYTYLFTFEGELNLQQHFFLPLGSKKIHGTCHADDAWYFMFFKNVKEYFNPNTTIGAAEKKVIKEMSTMFTNFAKNGNPNFDNLNWKPHSLTNPSYMKFGRTLEMMNGIIFQERKIFWKKLMKYIRENEAKWDQ